MLKKLLLVLFFFFSYCVARPFTFLQSRWYDSNKLSCSLVNNMIQDSYGFIWIGTENGLNKFDGWTFTQYLHNAKDPNSIKNNSIQSFLCDNKGRLWIGTGKGLQYYSPYNDNFLSVKFPKNEKPAVLNLLQLHSGEILAITSGYGIFSINPMSMKAISLNSINTICGTLYSRYALEDHLHRIWIALSNNNIVMINPVERYNKVIHLSKDRKEIITSILEDRNNRLWVAATTSLYLWDERSRTFMQIKNVDKIPFSIKNLIHCKDGKLLVNAGNNGLKYVDVATRTMRPYFFAGLPENDNYRTLYEDRNQNLWLCCYKNGIYMYPHVANQFDFTDITKLSKQANMISTIYVDNNNNIWIGTEEGILLKMNSNDKVISTYNVKRDIRSILEDNKSNYWICSSFKSTALYNNKSGQISDFQPFNGKLINTAIKGKDNAVYFSLYGEGFARYDMLLHSLKYINENTKFKSSSHLTNDWINTMLCDKDGLIWIGHCNGLSCYDPYHNRFLNLDSSFPPIVCYALMQDKNGSIWIGTSNGLYEYSKRAKRFVHYGTENGLPNNVVCGLGQSKNGDIWCSTYNGICKLDHFTHEIICYYSGNGLFDKQYLTGVYCQDASGYIYFGSIHGITKFMPDSIVMKHPLQRPLLTHLFINNKEVSAGSMINDKLISDDVLMCTKKIRLSYKDDNFSFEFSTLKFHDSKNISFEYRIKELSSIWKSVAVDGNRVTFNNISPGNYTFEIMARENGAKSPISAFLLYIAPPWYYSMFAKIIYIVIFICMIILVFHFSKLRQCRIMRDKIEKKKLDFYVNITHELRSPITLIINPLAALIRSENIPDKKDALLTIQRSAYRIVNLINQVHDIRKIEDRHFKMNYERTDMIQFINKQIEMFDYQAQNRNIKLTFNHEMDSLMACIDQNNFDKVLINLIDNAFKYTPDDGEITITSSSMTDNKGNRYVEICVMDTGIGIDESKLSRIFDRFYQVSSKAAGFGVGLNLAKMLVELHKGTIKAENRKDRRGSCFIVCIPLNLDLMSSDVVDESSVELDIPALSPIKAFIQEDANIPDGADSYRSKTRYKVLIVDDDKEMLDFLGKKLSTMYKIYSASNGMDAYQIILQKKVDLIISDVVMPDMDGFELLHKVKSNANINHIPFILLTSRVESDNRIKGWNIGADAFLAKPFLMEELYAICKDLISNRAQLKGKFSSEHEIEENINHIEMEDIDVQFMNRVMKVINKNIENTKLSVEMLAKEVGLSRVQLHRKIKTLTGTTPREFIRNIRLKQAANLLKSNNVAISQVSYAVGFMNPTSFSVVFKSFYGCTPSEYAEEYNRNSQA